MKHLSEGQAAVVAIIGSALVLSATLALAELMQRLTLTPPAADTKAQPPLSASVNAAVAQGRHLFLLNCAHCHGTDARGDEGPDLHDLHKSNARIHEVITTGIKGEMPSFAKKLNDSDVKALTDYLRTLRG